MLAPHSYLWRNRTADAWNSRYKKFPVKSAKDTAWETEHLALMECVRHSWFWYLKINGLSQVMCPIKGFFHDSLRVCINLLQLVFTSASWAVQSSAASLPLLEWGFDFIVEVWLCVSVANICSQCMCAMHIHICMQHVHTDVCIYVCSSCTYAVGRSCQPQL